MRGSELESGSEWLCLHVEVIEIILSYKFLANPSKLSSAKSDKCREVPVV